MGGSDVVEATAWGSSPGPLSNPHKPVNVPNEDVRFGADSPPNAPSHSSPELITGGAACIGVVFARVGLPGAAPELADLPLRTMGIAKASAGSLPTKYPSSIRPRCFAMISLSSLTDPCFAA